MIERLVPSRWSMAIAGAVVSLALTVAVVVATARGAGGSFQEAPASQAFPQFGQCPLAPASRYLPSEVGCLTVRRADVGGGGLRDLVLLYGHLNAKRLATGFTLAVVQPGGRTLRANVPRPDMNATISALRDVNARPGVEIFVHQAHVTTEEIMGVYAFDGHALVRAGSFAYGGEDAGIRFGFTCHAASIVQHEFQEQTPFKGAWEETSTTYRWDGARLARGASRSTRTKPTPASVGAHC